MLMLEVENSPSARFVQEAERRRLARELHDSVVQSLTALVTDLEYFRTRRLLAVGESSPEVVEKLESWQELARDSLLSMRQALGGLRKQNEALGLESSVQALLDGFKRSEYTVVYECEDWPSFLPFEYTSNLYYIVREALTNIEKHAKATTLSVFMFSHEGALHLSIGDNGIGMDTPPVSADGYHQGLIGLQERAALLGGQVSIESAPGKGTRIDVEVPWKG